MSDFKLVNIVDSQLEDITSELTLPVITGASSNNFQQFNAQASTNTSQTQFNIQIPSMETAVSRHFLVQSTVVLKIDFVTGTTWENEVALFSYGSTNALQAFPINALISTIQSNINNANVTVNTRDVMAGLLKMYNYEELARYNSLSPSLVDSFYQNFADGIGSNNNVLSNYSTGSYAKEYQPRGCFKVTISSDVAGKVPLPYTINSTDAGANPFASFYLTFTTTEPLLFLSPYISGNSNNQAAFLGLNNLTITMNYGDSSRVMSNASYALPAGATVGVKTISNVSLVSVSSSRLLLNFYTIPPQLFSKIVPKNVVNYNQYISYSYGSTLSPALATGDKGTIIFNNVQLNQVPSKILIYVRPTTLTTYDSNYFMVINSINLNFANKSGLLSSASQAQLYNMSVDNGLQMSFYEFGGVGVSSTSNGTIKNVPTIGSILVIDPSIDLSIDSQYSNMSGGQFNMQFQVNVTNQTNSETAITDLTAYLVVVNSGLFMTENGTSSFMTGLLNQEMVLDTKSENAITDKRTYEKDIVGGSIENINSIHKHLKGQYSNITQHEKKLDEEPGMDAGSGMSAGSIISSGRMQHGMKGDAKTKRRLHKYM